MTQFLGAWRRPLDHASIPVVGFQLIEVPAMTDRRLLRRYLALVRYAEELSDDCSASDDPAAAVPPPAEAVAPLDELIDSLGPIVESMAGPAPDPGELRRQLAGWVH